MLLIQNQISFSVGSLVTFQNITMDLFIINRYQEVDENSELVDREYKNLQKLKQRIEERRLATLAKSKTKLEEEIILKQEKGLASPEQHESEQSDFIKPKDIPDEPSENITSHQPITPKQEFKVLGVNEFEKKIKVKRVLPHWLACPYSVSPSLQNLTTAIKDLDWLHTSLKQTLQSEKITHLFPVQENVIPHIIEAHSNSKLFWPNDVCVSAPTGSGKTLAFVLPIVQVLLNSFGQEVQALVVLPVQELAAQVAKVFKKYTAKTGLRVMLLSGSVPLRQEQQQIVRKTESSGWVSEVDIIVCTAGRLVEHLHNTIGFSLKNLKFLVIDEADRIMDHIQNDWLYHLDRHIKLDSELLAGKVPNLSWRNLTSHKRPPQKLLFSATLSQDPEKLEQWGLFQPKLYSSHQISNNEDDDDEIRKYVTPSELVEKYVVCEAEEKPLVLLHLLLDKDWDKVLCFTNAAQSAHRLSVLCNNMTENKLKIAELSAALDRSTRDSVLKKFSAGEINVLMCTDALARGIDLPNCDRVICYDPPKNIKTYIHRVGRTGRAGRSGEALTVLLPNQVQVFQELLKSGGKENTPKLDISVECFEKLIPVYEEALNNTRNTIRSEAETKVRKSKAIKRGFRNAQGVETRKTKKFKKN